MSSTRSVKSLGVIASAAVTPIPSTPVAGVAYRDPTVAAADLPSGWKYGTPVDSAAQNEWAYRMSTMLDIMDKQGLLGWCDLVDYAVPALVFGSDGVLYLATVASGPSGVGAKDPTSTTGYWVPLASALGVLGVGQTWQNATGSRDLGTTYYNTTGRAIFVTAAFVTTGTTQMQLTINGTSVNVMGFTTGSDLPYSALIPPGASYSWSAISGPAPGIKSWTEVR